MLCFVGPPGVGKTSLGESIARATNRNFVRMALGGVRDEAEIRGHRRTYIGSLPGKIVQKLAKAGVRNPLFLLDEVDKMGMDHRGDPASALLEVLDPEQNHNFNDHYLEVDYDLSDVMFICTSNSMNIPAPLLDRMEVIRIPGYTEDEKVNIARRYLVPKQMKNAGLARRKYPSTTVRCATWCATTRANRGCAAWSGRSPRSAASAVKQLSLDKSAGAVEVELRDTWRILRGAQVPLWRGAREQPGRAGDRARLDLGRRRTAHDRGSRGAGQGSPGQDRLAGRRDAGVDPGGDNRGAQSRQDAGHRPDFHEKFDLHIHVPEGATPKDGPSAGIGMCTALVSVLTRYSVRADVAMTGEITLRGQVLAIGGLKEKLLAAHRGGIRTVIIPEENERDLKEIPDNIKSALEIRPVRWIDQVLDIALERMPEPVSDEEWKTLSEKAADEAARSADQGRINTH